jgi:hypothetical protein
MVLKWRAFIAKHPILSKIMLFFDADDEEAGRSGCRIDAATMGVLFVFGLNILSQCVYSFSIINFLVGTFLILSAYRIYKGLRKETSVR